MAIKRTFNGASIIKPGAYSKIVVENLTGFPLLPAGTVGIIGEALGGEPHVLDILAKEEIQDAKARYKSGPIADALGLLAEPSFDPAIPNGVSKVVIYKTNPSTQAVKVLKSNHAAPVNTMNLKTKNYGSDENLVAIQVAAGAIEEDMAKILGTISAPFVLSGGETLIVNANGTVYTFTNAFVGSAAQADVLAQLNNIANWAPAKPIIAVASGLDKVDIAIDPAVVVGGEYEYGAMKIDPASTIDTIVGLTGEARGVKGSRIIMLSKGTFTEVSPDLGGDAEMQIQYIGANATAVLSVEDISGEKKLKVVAGTDSIEIVLVDADGNNKHTLKSLADAIAASPAYVVSVLGANPQANAEMLDYVSDLDIKTVAAGLYTDMDKIADWMNTFSQLVEAVKISNIPRSLGILAQSLFSGAVDGASANLDYADGFEAMKEERIHDVVPLISKDIGAVAIDSVNALAAAHAVWGWGTTAKSERKAFISFLGSKSEFKDAAKAINSGYVTMVGQQVRVVDRFGDLKWMDPWALACIMAGMRAGAEVGEPLTHKTINVNDVRVYDGSWNPKKNYAEMIEAGCTIVEAMDAGGFRIVVGNTTYVTDGSFVWNRESVVQAAGYVAYDLRQNLELTFTGRKARTGTAVAIANFIKARMSLYLEDEIIVGDDINDGLGYKALSVSIQGNTAIIKVSITPVQGIDFLLPTIYLSDIRQNA